MKIAIDISQIIYEGTGVGEYTRQLVRSLLQIDKSNSYTLFGTTLRKRKIISEFAREIKIYPHARVINIPFSHTVAEILWNRFHKIPIELFTGPIDVLHTSDWLEPPSKARKVTTIHDLVVYKIPKYSHPKIIETQKRKLTWVKKESNKIITDSNATKQDIESILGIDGNLIHVIYPGIGHEFNKRNILEIKRVREKYGLGGNYLLSVGTVEPRKNLQVVIEAFRTIQNKSNDLNGFQLILAGKAGWGEIKESNNSILRIGYVQKEDLPALYSGAFCFIFPSLYEGFGLPVLEAMACECPVISSDRGSLGEIVKDGGILFHPQKETDLVRYISLLVNDPQFRKELVKKGKSNADRFKWEKAATQVLEVYKKAFFNTL